MQKGTMLAKFLIEDAKMKGRMSIAIHTLLSRCTPNAEQNTCGKIIMTATLEVLVQVQ